MKFILKSLKRRYIYITFDPVEIERILNMSDTIYIDYMLRMIEEDEK